MTQITLTLPDAIVAQLEHQIKQHNISLDDFALTLFRETLLAEAVDTLLSAEQQQDSSLALEALLAQIKATPPNPAMIIPPTQSLAEVVAYWQARPVEDTAMTPDEWDHLWAEFECQQKIIDQPAQLIRLTSQFSTCNPSTA